MNYDNFDFENRNEENSGSLPPENATGIVEQTVPYDFKKAKKSFSKIGFSYGVLVILALLSSLAIQYIVLIVKPSVYYTVEFRLFVSVASIYICSLPCMMIPLHRENPQTIAHEKFGFKSFMISIVICMGVVYIGSIIGNNFMSVLSRIVGYDYSNALTSVIDENKLWLTAIVTVIIAPIGEEFVFRKLLIDRTIKYGKGVSILLSGLLFGLMHGNFYQFFYATALGMIFAYIYCTTGKIGITMALHAIVNFMGSVVSSWITKGIDLENVAEDIMADPSKAISFIILAVYSVIIYGLMIASVVLLIVLRKKFKLKDDSSEKLPKGKAFSIVVFNVGMIFALVMFAIPFILSLIPA